MACFLCLCNPPPACGLKVPLMSNALYSLADPSQSISPAGLQRSDPEYHLEKERGRSGRLEGYSVFLAWRYPALSPTLPGISPWTNSVPSTFHHRRGPAVILPCTSPTTSENNDKAHASTARWISVISHFSRKTTCPVSATQPSLDRSNEYRLSLTNPPIVPVTDIPAPGSCTGTTGPDVMAVPSKS